MGSVRVCLKSLKFTFHRGHPPSFTPKNLLWRPVQLPPSSRSLCSGNEHFKLGGRQAERRRTSGQTEGQGGIRHNPTSQRGQDLWGDEVGRRSSHPKSVFAAGTAKRTTEYLKRKTALVSEDKENPERRRKAVRMQAPDRPLTVAEWRNLKESLGNPQRFDIHMMGALYDTKGELDIAKSLLTFVATETGTLSYELLLRYLTLCVSGGHEAEVFDVYDIMRGTFPSLDTGASSLFIKSFSCTARWREAIVILNQVKKACTPSPRNYGDIIAAAMHNNDTATAWSLYDELMEKELSPHQVTWEALFSGRRTEEKEQEQEQEGISEREEQARLQGILLHMRDNQIYPQPSLATSIKNWFESLKGQGWTARWTSTTPKGACRCCGSELESIQLTAEEYQQLRDRVMADIIQGRDVFNKTTPEELERFRAFVKKKPAFGVVIDGLNVANINKDKTKQSQTLLAVVSELERQGLIPLVLGRKHMLQPSRSWDRHNMNLIQQKAHCFFTENISEDDPFLLYATLHSGNHCLFVSRDLMRDHKACLPDGAARRLFFKWQRGHQLVLDGYVVAGRRVRFLSIPSYDTIVQTSGDSWHIPYDHTEDRSTYEVPQRWLCITKKQ